jgi:hypothetical protein
MLHAKGPAVRRALRHRLAGGDRYRKLIAHETRPTSYVWSGLGFRYPIASTRADLDVIARMGARLWAIAGLTEHDVLLSAVPVGSTTEHVALSYAAMAAGAPALFPGADPVALVATARLARPTVIAVPSLRAAEVLTTLTDADVSLATVRTVLLVGAPNNGRQRPHSCRAPPRWRSMRRLVRACSGRSAGRAAPLPACTPTPTSTWSSSSIRTAATSRVVWAARWC